MNVAWIILFHSSAVKNFFFIQTVKPNYISEEMWNFPALFFYPFSVFFML